MNAQKGLVLDANILLRAVFGQRIRQILETHENEARFYAPDVFDCMPPPERPKGLDLGVAMIYLGQHKSKYCRARHLMMPMLPTDEPGLRCSGSGQPNRPAEARMSLSYFWPRS